MSCPLKNGAGIFGDRESTCRTWLSNRCSCSARSAPLVGQAVTRYEQMMRSGGGLIVAVLLMRLMVGSLLRNSMSSRIS
jgi:hypothetical protein